jgi:hypothetical protein
MKRRAAHIISGASLARRTVNLPSSIVKIRFWQPGQFVVAGFRRVSKNSVPYRGTEGSNPAPSSGAAAEKTALYSGTAARVYRLTAP